MKVLTAKLMTLLGLLVIGATAAYGSQTDEPKMNGKLRIVPMKPEHLRYTGKPYSKALGAYVFNYRNYDPQIARWTTPDPSGFPDGANNASYLNNQVTFCLDPSGLDIYHINNENAVAGFGHSAAIVGNASTGYDYNSYGPDGVSTGHFNTIDQALGAAKQMGYTREEHWYCDSGADDGARQAANSFKNTTYNVTSHNCIDMVNAMLEETGVTYHNAGEIPNYNWYVNQSVADGWSSLE